MVNAPSDDEDFDQVVKSFRLTQVACPMQYEGELEDGRWFRFSYRWGFASLSLGRNDFEIAIDPKPAVLPLGQDSDGWMSKSDFRVTLLRLLRKYQEDRTEKED